MSDLTFTEWCFLAVFGGWATWILIGDIQRDREIREANEQKDPQ